MPVGYPIFGQPAPGMAERRLTEQEVRELARFDEVFREIFGARRQHRVEVS